MNDIKTSERESLGQEVVCNIMHWHIGSRDLQGKAMPCKDVPVMAILKEWRSMATGPKGRRPHRPQPKIEYPYKKADETYKKADEKAEASSST